MNRGIFGNLQKVLNQPHGTGTGDHSDTFMTTLFTNGFPKWFPNKLRAWYNDLVNTYILQLTLFMINFTVPILKSEDFQLKLSFTQILSTMLSWTMIKLFHGSNIMYLLFLVFFSLFNLYNCFPGMTFYNHLAGDKLKGKSKSSVKPSFPRSSTLMKPTASQLAKQNLKPQIGGSR